MPDPCPLETLWQTHTSKGGSRRRGPGRRRPGCRYSSCRHRIVISSTQIDNIAEISQSADCDRTQRHGRTVLCIARHKLNGKGFLIPVRTGRAKPAILLDGNRSQTAITGNRAQLVHRSGADKAGATDQILCLPKPIIDPQNMTHFMQNDISQNALALHGSQICGIKLHDAMSWQKNIAAILIRASLSQYATGPINRCNACINDKIIDETETGRNKIRNICGNDLFPAGNRGIEEGLIIAVAAIVDGNVKAAGRRCVRGHIRH